eukprot:scaffold279_cov229-Pinguiococcus_pyrenoidosus.AAC.1
MSAQPICARPSRSPMTTSDGNPDRPDSFPVAASSVKLDEQSWVGNQSSAFACPGECRRLEASSGDADLN